jgi:prepilin-type N-terminal cleavage/methylation domain-containing protein
MRSQNPQRDRDGFTLLELVIAIMLIGITLGLTVPFFRTQVQAFGNTSGRDDAAQNARYGVSMIDRELRVAGIGVVDAQPMVLQAASNAITFNVDLVSRLQSDAAAAYFDPDEDPGAVVSLPRTSRITLPLSGFQYPDSNYWQALGEPSAAETVSFWVAPDPDPLAKGTNILYRRVNNLAPTVVAKSITILPGEPVFRYFKADTLGQLVEIPQSSLPIYHSAPIHNSKADTLTSALTDSIRVVRVRLTGVYVDRAGKKLNRPIETGIRIMNAGLLHFATCGDPPLFTSAITAVPNNSVSSPKVLVGWSSSVDQAAGEKDVEQYSIYRRKDTDLAFTEPLASIPSGSSTYSFTDTQVASGDRWVYGVAARDCGGQSSAVMTSPLVVVP